MQVKHPVNELAAAFYHGVLAGFLLLGLAFHTYAALAHWKDRNNGGR